jgi:hypothetical protein
VLSTLLSPGTYWVVIEGFASEHGQYTMAVTCPAGSWVQSTISCGGAPVTGSTSGGTSSVGNESPEHYFQLSAPFSGVYTFDSCGSSFDTWIHVFEANTLLGATSPLGNMVASCKHFSLLRSLASPARTQRMLPI